MHAKITKLGRALGVTLYERVGRRLVLIPAGHRLATLARDTSARVGEYLAEFSGLAIIVPPADRPHRRTLERALLDAGASWRVAAEVDGWDLMTHFVGLGLAGGRGERVRPPAGRARRPARDRPAGRPLMGRLAAVARRDAGRRGRDARGRRDRGRVMSTEAG